MILTFLKIVAILANIILLMEMWFFYTHTQICIFQTVQVYMILCQHHWAYPLLSEEAKKTQAPSNPKGPESFKSLVI